MERGTQRRLMAVSGPAGARRTINWKAWREAAQEAAAPPSLGPATARGAGAPDSGNAGTRWRQA
jgi:hypothetical protein